jgi:hypothetical protein
MPSARFLPNVISIRKTEGDGMERFGGRLRLLLAAIMLMTAAACGIGVNEIDEFQGAVDAGAPCEELFDQRANFPDERDLETIDEILDSIGCESRTSERTDV